MPPPPLHLAPHLFSLNSFLKKPLAPQGPEEHITLMYAAIETSSALCGLSEGPVLVCT